MRIAFKPIYPTNINELEKTIKDFDIIDRLDPTPNGHYNYYNVFDVQSYSDGSRYNLNLYKIDYNRKYFNYTNTNPKTIQVIDLNLTFDFDFYFELLSDRYVDMWKNDSDIDYIRPYCYSSDQNNNIGYYVFKSVITGLYTKMLNLITADNVICFKYNNKILLAYILDSNFTNNNLDDILDYFLSAAYELVKIVEYRLNVNLPAEMGVNKIYMQQWYDTRRKMKPSKYLKQMDANKIKQQQLYEQELNKIYENDKSELKKVKQDKKEVHKKQQTINDANIDLLLNQSKKYEINMEDDVFKYIKKQRLSPVDRILIKEDRKIEKRKVKKDHSKK